MLSQPQTPHPRVTNPAVAGADVAGPSEPGDEGEGHVSENCGAAPAAEFPVGTQIGMLLLPPTAAGLLEPLKLRRLTFHLRSRVFESSEIDVSQRVHTVGFSTALADHTADCSQ